MAQFLEVLRTGDWLTAARMRLWALAVLAASSAALVYLLVTSNGLIDYQGRPIGTDFASFYAAGTLVLEGQTQAAYDGATHYARQQALFGAATPYYGWLYPPFFLFIAGALALLPYLLALLVWQGATFTLYLTAIGALIRSITTAASGIQGNGLWLLLATAYPAVLINLGHGQNGFLTAALFAGALAMLDRRPVIAGVLFGLLVYKPQFGLLIPLALLATARWRTIAAAAATVVLLVLTTVVAFGPDVWSAFIASSKVARVALIESGEVGWHKVQSVLAWVRMWGGSLQTAYAIHGVVALIAAGAIVWLWRGTATYALKAAGLACASIIVAFHSHDYDLMVLAPVIVLLGADGLSRGFLPYEKTILAAVWIAPLLTRSLAQVTLIPLGTIATLALFALVMRRAAGSPAIEPLAPATLGPRQSSVR
jgi:alpha-1,2-mannosyltransferase